MRNKRLSLTVFAASLFFLLNAVCWGVETRQVDIVRDKGVLDSSDFETVDTFVGEAVQELTETRDFASVAEVRGVILSRAGSNKPSAQLQYTQQFFDSARKHISGALEKASQSSSEGRRFLLTLNLLILVDYLNNAELVELCLDSLKDENMAIRYWAVRCVTNGEIVRQLNSSDRGRLVSRITAELGQIVQGSSFEIIELAAAFAANIKTAGADEMLLKIADMRIDQYSRWTVEHKIVDASVLKSLCRKISEAGAANPACARRFAQLYSYVIQRYIRDNDVNSNMSASERNQLVSVMVEIEKNCISVLLDKPQTTIKSAIERGDVLRLMREHNRLLGDETGSGELMGKLECDYGESPDGGKQTMPLSLPEPPEQKAS